MPAAIGPRHGVYVIVARPWSAPAGLDIAFIRCAVAGTRRQRAMGVGGDLRKKKKGGGRVAVFRVIATRGGGSQKGRAGATQADGAWHHVEKPARSTNWSCNPRR